MLGEVGSNLKWLIFMQHLWMLHDVVVVWPGSCNRVAPGHVHALLRFSISNMLQHILTGSPNARNMLRPRMLRLAVLKCCDSLAGN